ncbi:MAG: hypothetical protein ACHQT7_02065 [Candidatus Levyibacteriota bacterium]
MVILEFVEKTDSKVTEEPKKAEKAVKKTPVKKEVKKQVKKTAQPKK